MAEIETGLGYGGVAGFCFGITDRSIAALSDGYINALDLILLFTASWFFVCWLFLKPAK